MAKNNKKEVEYDEWEDDFEDRKRYKKKSLALKRKQRLNEKNEWIDSDE